MRGPQDRGMEWSMEHTEETILRDLDELGIHYSILFNVKSPRMIHDDSPVYIDQRETNQKYDY